eukprot:1495226-Amphidinium_carterae.1
MYATARSKTSSEHRKPSPGNDVLHTTTLRSLMAGSHTPRLYPRGHSLKRPNLPKDPSLVQGEGVECSTHDN